MTDLCQFCKLSCDKNCFLFKNAQSSSAKQLTWEEMIAEYDGRLPGGKSPRFFC